MRSKNWGEKLVPWDFQLNSKSTLNWGTLNRGFAAVVLQIFSDLKKNINEYHKSIFEAIALESTIIILAN